MEVCKKVRRHHNNYGKQQVRSGKTALQLKAICRRLGLPFREIADTTAHDGDDRCEVAETSGGHHAR